MIFFNVRLFFYMNAFFWVAISFGMAGSQPKNRQLFFPDKGSSAINAEDARLDLLKDSFQAATGKSKNMYLEALAAEVDEKRAKSDQLSVKGYQEYLLSLPHGSLIQKKGSVPQVIWSLLQNDPLNKEIVELLQSFLENLLKTSVVANTAQLQEVVQKYEGALPEVNSSKFFCDLKKIIAQQQLMETESRLRIGVRQEEKFAGRKKLLEELTSAFLDKAGKKSLSNLLETRKFYSLSKFRLILENEDRTFSPEDFTKRSLDCLSRYDNPHFYSRLAEKIRNQTIPSKRTSGPSAGSTVIRFGCCDIDKMLDVDLSGIESSCFNKEVSRIIVVTGHTACGDRIEVIKIPELNRFFYRMESIERSAAAATARLPQESAISAAELEAVPPLRSLIYTAPREARLPLRLVPTRAPELPFDCRQSCDVGKDLGSFNHLETTRGLKCPDNPESSKKVAAPAAVAVISAAAPAAISAPVPVAESAPAVLPQEFVILALNALSGRASGSLESCDSSEDLEDTMPLGFSGTPDNLEVSRAYGNYSEIMEN
jgi:hypothetical protein